MGSENRGVEGLIGDQPQKYYPSLLVPVLCTNDPGACVKLKYVAHYVLSKNRSIPGSVLFVIFIKGNEEK